jgi:hypothetical protein
VAELRTESVVTAEVFGTSEQRVRAEVVPAPLGGAAVSAADATHVVFGGGWYPVVCDGRGVRGILTPGAARVLRLFQTAAQRPRKCHRSSLQFC